MARLDAGSAKTLTQAGNGAARASHREDRAELAEVQAQLRQLQQMIGAVNEGAASSITPGTITTDGDTITVTLSRRAYSPVLRQSDLRADTTVPWWQNRRLRFQFS